LSQNGALVDDALWAGIEPQLAGEAAAELNAARGAAEQKIGLAAGDARRFTLTEAAQAAAPQQARWRLWLQTLAETLPGKKKLILDDRAAGRRHLLLDSSGGGASRLVPVVSPEQNEEP
jgi:regulator of protease activity HflC (stomatin/prohibitin superfamily)